MTHVVLANLPPLCRSASVFKHPQPISEKGGVLEPYCACAWHSRVRVFLVVCLCAAKKGESVMAASRLWWASENSLDSLSHPGKDHCLSSHTQARKLLKMQITLKTLQQQTFKIDIDAEETVRYIHSGGMGSRHGAAKVGLSLSYAIATYVPARTVFKTVIMRETGSHVGTEH